MAVEVRKEHFLGLIKGQAKDLPPRSRVVLRNSWIGYEEEEDAAFAAERNFGEQRVVLTQKLDQLLSQYQKPVKLN